MSQRQDVGVVNIRRRINADQPAYDAGSKLNQLPECNNIQRAYYTGSTLNQR